ncbi:branched-chain amino acid transport system substrate-binding protein [Comamonas sp. BIGb0152]|uniref:ABC transporter substrate-binding protein n=1 Tax=Comamonas sp. BIGb0152 TaxID=2940601 RepID=UPI0021697F17|nr:ABC transporter substrate-binding protein [Comamonas sp. BIGb0152]MCS4295542.1 branched-chain amino acid transport system substrate-binding protein [Comamonas sp. BIGb0152]
MKKAHGPLTAAALAVTALLASGAQAAPDKVKIAFITDMSGLYSDFDGPGGLDAVRMAVADFGGEVLGRKIEIISADHQNKADIAASKARQWWDSDNVDLIIGGSNSAVSLAISNLSKDKKKVFISAGAGADSLTEEACQPYMVRYTYSTSAQARGTAAALVGQGYKDWYFLTSDYAFGHSMEQAAMAVVKQTGGTVVGAVRHPLSTSDFSSYVMKAQSSGAKVMGLANGGGDTINAIKTAKEFGIDKKMNVAVLMAFITDIHSLGLGTTGGMYLTEGWYWDMSEGSRAFSQRFYDKNKKMPTTFQAGDYSATTTYLKAVQKAGTTEPDQVMAALKSLPIDDMFAKGYIRADGAMVHDMYLMQVKKPAESTKPWDYYKVVSTIPGDKAYAPSKEGACPLLKPAG